MPWPIGGAGTVSAKEGQSHKIQLDNHLYSFTEQNRVSQD